MSRKRWKYTKSKYETDDLALATLLFSESITQRKLSLWQPKLEFESEPLTTVFDRISSMFDPMVWASMKKYMEVRKPRLTKKMAAQMAGLSVYKFGKEMKRLNTLLEMAVKTWR